MSSAVWFWSSRIGFTSVNSADVMTSARVASPVIGLGLLQSIPEENLFALADPGTRLLRATTLVSTRRKRDNG